MSFTLGHIKEVKNKKPSCCHYASLLFIMGNNDHDNYPTPCFTMTYFRSLLFGYRKEIINPMLIASLHLDLMHQFSIYVAGAIRGTLNQLHSDLFPKYMSLFSYFPLYPFTYYTAYSAADFLVLLILV